VLRLRHWTHLFLARNINSSSRVVGHLQSISSDYLCVIQASLDAKDSLKDVLQRVWVIECSLDQIGIDVWVGRSHREERWSASHLVVVVARVTSTVTVTYA
jgi:hypothetical protein